MSDRNAPTVTPPEPDDLRAELAEVVEDLREQQAAIRDLSARVLLDPTAEDAAEGDRRDHLQRRRELLGRISALILRWVDQGGAVQLVMPVLAAEAEAPAAVDAADDTENPATLSTGTPTAGGDAEAEVVVQQVDDDTTEVAALTDSVPSLPAHVAPRPATAPPDATRLQGALGPAWARDLPSDEPPPRPLDVELLRQILARLGPPSRDLDSDGLPVEVECLARETASSRLLDWVRLPKDIQRQLVAMTAARARRVQKIVSPTAPIELTLPLARIFSALTRFSASEQPGFVVGLQRDHEPRGESWLDDALAAHDGLNAMLPVERPSPKPNPEKALQALRDALRDGAPPENIVVAVALVLDSGVVAEDLRLIDLLTPRADELSSLLGAKARFKRLRRALRERMTGDDDDDDPGTAGDVPSDWAYWSRTVGKRGVIIGGDLREEARTRLEEAFRFASLEWVTTDSIRSSQQLAQSIGAGKVDLVIILARFMSHAIQDSLIPACKDAGTPWVVVERGYGVTQVRLAIERYLGGSG